MIIRWAGIIANELGTQARIDGNVVTGFGAQAGLAQLGIQAGYGADADVKGPR